MENQQAIPISDNYPISIYILMPIITIYCGLFLNISNHYVLSPKIQSFLEKVSINSTLAIEVILDVLSNLSFITYSISAFSLTRTTDYPFRILQYYNSYWLTISLAIVIYLKIRPQVVISNIIFYKNGVILCLCYVNILYHYISQSQIITLPAIMAGLYLINLFLNAYQQKFIQTIRQLLSLKKPPVFKPKPKMISHLPTVQILSKNYPITKQQLSQHIQMFEKGGEYRQTVNKNQYRKPIKTKIDTKLLVRQKLLQICMSVHLSMKKKEEEEIMTLRKYFGFMNGTMSDNGSTVNKPSAGVKRRKTYFNNRNKDKIQVTKRSTKKLKKQSSINSQQKKKVKKMEEQQIQNNILHEYNQKGLEQKEEIAAQSLESESILFYIFPVKIFESSKIISIVFSVLINLGFGFLLNYSVNVMNGLKYGGFCDFVFALLFLPIIPNISPLQYVNTMALSSILKFGICGILGCINNAIVNPDDYMTITWVFTRNLQYNTIVQIIILIFCYGVTVLEKNIYKTLILLFLIALGANGTIYYFGVTQN